MFAVGDDDQSIYAFRGANVANMQHFERDFGRPGMPVRLIKLEQNYRSHGHILDAANALIRNNPTRLGKNLWTRRGQGRAGARLRGAVGHRRGGVHRRHRRRACAADGLALSEVAVLYRSNAQSRVLEHALFNAGVPYRVYGGMRFFERAEVKHALAYLRLVAAPDDDGAFLRVVNFPPRGIGARTLESLQDAARAAGHEPVAGRVRGCRRRQGGREPRRLRRADRGDARRRGRAAAARSGRARASTRPASSRTTRPRRTAQDRLDNLEELVNAADGFLREADLAVDAPIARRARRRRRRGSRGRDRSADRVPRPRGARGGRDAGGRRAGRRCSS